MNNEYESKAYPCDEPEAKSSYPCDTDGEAFSYASDDRTDGSNMSAEPNSIQERKGKGKRGGNAAASKVIHSGNVKKFFSKADESADGSEDSSDSEGRSYDRKRSGSYGHDRRDMSEKRDFGKRGASDRYTDRNSSDRRYSDRRSYEHSDGRGYGHDRNVNSYTDSDRRPYPMDRDEDSRSYGHDNGERRYSDRRSSDRNGYGRDNAHGGRFDRDNSGRRSRDNDRNAAQNRGRSDREDRNRGGRPQSPEAVFSRAYDTKIIKTSDVGAFVSAPDDILNGAYGRKVQESGLVLLPFSEQIGRPQPGTAVRVYFYEDKGGRLTATMRTPILRDGEVGILKVAAVTKIGVFLDNGVPKQVLLPFKEQIESPEVGDEVLVWLYSDKSGRQAATMRVYGHLDRQSPYKEDDRVTGFVYEINPKLGIFVAVDNKYYGLVPINETFKDYEYGDEVEARVSKVRDDGKLDLLIRDKLYKTVNEDADVILYELRRNNGFLNYGDRADAEFIEETYAMSKNQFKRALGHLYKNHIVELDRENDTVRLIESKD